MLSRTAAADLVLLLQRELDMQPPQAVLQAAWQHFGRAALLSCSGAEDVALVGLMRDFDMDFRVFSLDTGRLHPETYQVLEDIRLKYAIELEIFSPDTHAVEHLVRHKGLFSFYRDGHTECCAIRKVEPLQRALHGAPAWITGQRRDQSPDTRAEVPVVQIDEARSTATHAVLKFNPLARWTSAQVWKYLRAAGVPYNPLHERGYVSIGCAPCTRPVLPGQHEREGRWWWESPDHKECGLHADRQTPTASR